MVQLPVGVVRCLRPFIGAHAVKNGRAKRYASIAIVIIELYQIEISLPRGRKAKYANKRIPKFRINTLRSIGSEDPRFRHGVEGLPNMRGNHLAASRTLPRAKSRLRAFFDAPRDDLTIREPVSSTLDGAIRGVGWPGWPVNCWNGQVPKLTVAREGG